MKLEVMIKKNHIHANASQPKLAGQIEFINKTSAAAAVDYSVQKLGPQWRRRRPVGPMIKTRGQWTRLRFSTTSVFARLVRALSTWPGTKLPSCTYYHQLSD